MLPKKEFIFTGGEVMETKIKVLIADPNEDFRLLLKSTLEAEGDMEVVAAAADGAETLALLK